MVNVNNKKIRTTLMTVFSKTFNIFYTFFSVPIANFEQENFCWEQSLTEHVSEKRDMRKKRFIKFTAIQRYSTSYFLHSMQM